MALQKPSLHEVAYKTYMINCFGLQSPTLILGEDKALLIDTSVGSYDIAAFVREVTDLPLIVAASHSHGDHVGGLGQFPEVYIHPADMDTVQPMTEEGVARYTKMIQSADTWGCFDYPTKLIPWQYETKLLPMEDGHVFDLGGRTVTVYHTPGHTKGECVFVDHASRILFSGDAANRNLGILACTVDTALQGLLRLKEHEADWDRNFTGHLGWGGNLAQSVSEGPVVLNTCIEILKGLSDGTLEGSEQDVGVFGRRCCYTRNGVRISYSKEKIH